MAAMIISSAPTQPTMVGMLTNYVQADAEQQLKSLGVSVLVTQADQPIKSSRARIIKIVVVATAFPK